MKTTRAQSSSYSSLRVCARSVANWATAIMIVQVTVARHERIERALQVAVLLHVEIVLIVVIVERTPRLVMRVAVVPFFVAEWESARVAHGGGSA